MELVLPNELNLPNFWIDIGECEVCNVKDIPVLHADNSGDEYSDVEVCQQCITKYFEIYHRDFCEKCKEKLQ